MRLKHTSKQRTDATHDKSEEAPDFEGVRIVPAQYGRWKHLVERPVALLLLIIGMPVVLAAIVVVRLTSRGPAIFRQMRVGLKGRTFMMYKLRTMRQDAESGSGPVWAQREDPRVTPVGRILRKLHLDEIPQLVNVIKGEMELIGPRPERPEFTQLLAHKIPGYMQRHIMRPGITGWAQIHLPPDTDLNSVRRKLALDLDYIENCSFALDFRIFLATFLRLVGLRHGHAVWLLGLQNPVIAQLHPSPPAPAAREVLQPLTEIDS